MGTDMPSESARGWYRQQKDKDPAEILKRAYLDHVCIFMIEAKRKALSKNLEKVMPQVAAECIAV